MVKLLFSVGSYSNVEVECNNITEAKQAYDQCVMLWGKPQEEKKPVNNTGYSKGGNTGGKGKFTFQKPQGQPTEAGSTCLSCGKPLVQSKKGNWFCSCWYK